MTPYSIKPKVQRRIIMKQGKLFYDKECGRYNFYYKEDEMKMDYGGIHCGEV